MKKTKVNPLSDNLFFGMIRFSLPIVSICLLTMLFSSADMAVIGRFGHKNAVSAIGATSTIISMLIGSLTALSIGVTVSLGSLYGKEDKREINNYVNTMPLTAFMLGLLLTIFAEVFAPQILHLVNCQELLWTDAIIYFRIYFLAVPFTVTYCFLSAVLQAGGDSVRPLLFEILSFVINIILNLFFVICLDLNVMGVALATLISQAICCLSCIIYLCLQDNELALRLNKQRLFINTRSLWRIGIPASLESTAMNLTGIVISAFMNKFPPDVIAGNAIAQSIEGLIVVSFVGFSNASVVFISQNVGAGQMERVKKSFLISLATVFILGESMGIIIYLLSDYILLIFTSSPSIMEVAGIRLFFMCNTFGLCGTMNTISGCIRGLGDSSKPLAISLLCSVGFRLTWLFFLAIPRQSLPLTYLCFPICWGMITVLGTVVFIIDYCKLKKG